MEVKHVPQKDQFGCAPACLAMVLGTTYEAATGMVPAGFLDNGTDVVALQKALIKRKHRVVYRHRLARPFAPVHILCIGGNPTLQLHETGAMRHLVVMDEHGFIHDPAVVGTTFARWTNIGQYVYWTLGIYPPEGT